MNAFSFKSALLTSLCVLSVFFAFSCTNEENDKEKSSELSLTISGSNGGAAKKASLRSAGLPGDEGIVNRITIGVFNSDGSLNTMDEFAMGDLISNPDGSYSTSLSCTPGTGCSIVIIANAPAGTFLGDETKADFIAELVDLQQTADVTLANQISSDLPMSGESTNVTFTANTSTDVNVSLSRLVSRIVLNSVTTAFEAGGQYANATFKITKVFLYNSLKTSTVAAGNSSTTFPTVADYYHGGTSSGLPLVWENLNDFVRDDLASAFAVTSGTPYTASHFFYTFPNPSSNTTKTKLVIGGLFDRDGAAGVYSEEVVYFPIVINKNQTGTTITEGGVGQTGRSGYIDRNNIYNLSAVIKGNGVVDPNLDIEPADLNLTVTVADWALTVTQEVVFE